nr:arginine biosynthesis bifunctional protein argj, mitochondrial [Quercus suber]
MAVRHGEAKRFFFAACQQARTYSASADRSIPAAKQKYVPTSGTYPKGFLVGSAHAGVKASNTKYDDIAMVISEQPCVAGAVFTRNVFKAAPVQTSRSTLYERRGEGVRGVVVNSGCANAVTGTLGKEHADAMARATDDCFGGSSDGKGPQTLVMSTGVIGQRLPIDRITQAIPKAHKELGSSHESWLKAAKAICTTDTFPKLISRTFTLPSHPDTEYRIAGMTKGAGMIAPNMATLLGIICTDVKLHPDSVRSLLAYANTTSFNSITIDGDTSTNDTVALLANGAAAPEGVRPVALPFNVTGKVHRENVPDDVKAFQKVLGDFMTDLAKLVVRDGEGATKFVTVRVISDVSGTTAKRAAVSIAKSPLVKTALYGKDANWGRILCAIGYAPGIISSDILKLGSSRRHIPQLENAGSLHQTQVEASRTSVSFMPSDGSEPLKLVVRGEPEQIDEVRAKEILEMEDLEILVDLADGPSRPQHLKSMSLDRKNEHVPRMHEAAVYTCDFSHEYVTINGDYRT